MRVKPWDILIIFLALVICGFSAFRIYTRQETSSRFLIQGSGRDWIFPLDAEETVEVPGPLGNTIVRIHDREAWVESSPCANQICVEAGHIHRQGVWIACLPNNVIIIIEGFDDHGPDVLAW